MRKHWTVVGLWTLVSIVLLVACAQRANAAPPVPSTATPLRTATPTPPTVSLETPALEIIGPDGTQPFALTDLLALPAIEDHGGVKSSTGKITSTERLSPCSWCGAGAAQSVAGGPRRACS